MRTPYPSPSSSSASVKCCRSKPESLAVRSCPSAIEAISISSSTSSKYQGAGVAFQSVILHKLTELSLHLSNLASNAWCSSRNRRFFPAITRNSMFKPNNTHTPLNLSILFPGFIMCLFSLITRFKHGGTLSSFLKSNSFGQGDFFSFGLSNPEDLAVTTIVDEGLYRTFQYTSSAISVAC